MRVRNIAENLAMRIGKLFGVLSFIIITAANINLRRDDVNEVDKKVEKETKDIKHDLVQELKKIYNIFIYMRRK